MIPSPTLLRVASYNTRDFLDDARAAARVVRAIGPDVLCLQEVPRRFGAGRRVEAFAQDCGMRRVGRHRGSGGTTIFVGPAVRLLDSSHVRLPVALLARTRGYAVARLAVPGWPAVTVASVHLSLRADERERHTRSILARLGSVDSADTEGVTIVGGDLNEGSTGRAHQLFLRGLQVVSPSMPTYPVWRPQAVLDVLFASPTVEVVDGAVVALPETDVRAASDHRPVWVDLALRSPRSGGSGRGTGDR